MGMFGPNKDDFDTFKNEFEALKSAIALKFSEIEVAINSRASDSENEAKIAAENAKTMEKTATETAAKINEAADEIHTYKSSLDSEVVALKGRVNATSELAEDLKTSISEVKALHLKFLNEKETVDEEIADLAEKISKTNEYLEQAQELPEAVTEAMKLVDEASTLSESVKNVLTNVVGRKNEVDKLHKEIFGEDADGPDGTAVHIDGLKDELEAAYKKLESEVVGLELAIDEAADNVVEKHESLLTKRQEDYDLLVKEAGARYTQVNAQLTGLLPGAMAEGLSAAYEKKKESEETALAGFERRFSVAILGLVAVSVIPFAVDIYLLAIKGRDLVQVVQETPSLIVAILPIYFPVLWMAYSMSKKANLSKRLIEEYTHKSVLGKTFSGLSNQIETLQNQSAVKEELRTKLLFNVLQVSAENPGKLITDYNQSNHPLMDALEKSGKLTDALESLSKIPGFSALAKRIAAKDRVDLKVQEERVEAGLSANDALDDAPSDSSMKSGGKV